MSFLDPGPSSFTYENENLLFSETTGPFLSNCVCRVLDTRKIQGNENLFIGIGSHDQDGCHAHIW